MESNSYGLKSDLSESFIDSIIECVVEMESSGRKLDAKTLKKHYDLAKELAGMSLYEE